MTVTLTHRQGSMTVFSDEGELDNLLSELDESPDSEHPDVSISLDSRLTLSAFRSGRVVLEDVEGDTGPLHQRDVNRADVRVMFELLARAEVRDLFALDWQPGYGA